MKIYNETKTQLLTEQNCDLTKGYFVEEEMVVGTRPSLIEKSVSTNGKILTTKHNSLQITESILIYKLFSAKQNYEREISELEKWFETEYREQLEECNRKIALGICMKDGTNPQTILNVLYAEAEVNANRINDLRTLVASL